MPFLDQSCPPLRQVMSHTIYAPSIMIILRGQVFSRRATWKGSLGSLRWQASIMMKALCLVKQRERPLTNKLSNIHSLIAAFNGEAINGKSLIRSSIQRKQCKRWFTRRSGSRCAICSLRRKLKRERKEAVYSQLMSCRTFRKIKI